MTPLQRKAAWLVSLGEYIDGYDMLVMGTALVFLRPAFDSAPPRSVRLAPRPIWVP